MHPHALVRACRSTTDTLTSQRLRAMASSAPATAAVASSASAAPAPSARPRRKLLLDTDGGCDDAVALLLAMRDPNTEIVAITSCFGNVKEEQARGQNADDTEHSRGRTALRRRRETEQHSAPRDPSAQSEAHHAAARALRAAAERRADACLLAWPPCSRPENIYTILRVFGLLDSIPFYSGAAQALVSDSSRIETWPGHGLNGLGDASFLEGGKTHDHQAYQKQVAQALGKVHAVTAMIDLAKQHAGELDIIALGPLTNLALAARMDPQFPSRIRSLTLMGGSSYAKGNASMAAEFNFYCDAEAAHVVFNVFPSPTCTVTVVPWSVDMHACACVPSPSRSLSPSLLQASLPSSRSFPLRLQIAIASLPKAVEV